MARMEARQAVALTGTGTDADLERDVGADHTRSLGPTPRSSLGTFASLFIISRDNYVIS